ncbi:acyltransferase family protein [Thiothrix eikelboomii]|uniref:acyltransferase family protein n=1 Tax=Thiothrix eikelboomii TaxID=92487 RepID=UPI003BAE833E
MPTNAEHTLNYRADIDILRGVAVSLVVFFHAFPETLPGGFIGVDIFFVISGFLITSIMLQDMQSGCFSLSTFYARRIRRLFPALITVLITTGILGWLILFPDELKQVGQHVSDASIYLLNFSLINETGYFDVASHYKPLLHLWSLSIEEQFYFIWPLALFFIWKIRINPLWILIPITILSLIAMFNIADETAYYHTLTRIWQLSSGSILAVFLRDYTPPHTRYLLWLGVFFIGVYSLFIEGNNIYRLALSVLPVLGTILILSASSQTTYSFGFRSLGLISYPLYLWHWIIFSFLTIYIGKKPNTLSLIIAIVLSIFLAWLTYRYIEKLRYRKGTIVPYLLATLLGIGAVGLWVDHQDGLPQREHLSYLNNHSIQFTRTPATDQECDGLANNILKNKRLFDYCRSERLDSSNGVVAIIGDSHAHVLFPGIAKEAERVNMGTLLLANSSCPTLVGFEWGRNDEEIVLCKQKIKQIFSILKSQENIKKVIISTRGPVYIHGEVINSMTLSNVRTSLKQEINHRQTYDTFRNGLASSLKTLQEILHIRSIFLVLENPEIDFLPKERVERPFDFFGISGGRTTIPKEAYLLRMEEHIKQVVAATKGTRTEILDPTSIFCPDAVCISRIKNGFLYADDDHFSILGSEYVASYFSSRIFNEN